MNGTGHNGLRVAFVAGTLGQGGAEKQLVYMVRALLRERVEVRIYSLTRGEHHEAALRSSGADVVWVGNHSNPAGRLISLTASLCKYKPHVVQSAHFYTNLYVGLAAWTLGAVAVGAIRNDLTYEMESNPFWGRFLKASVHSLIANSQDAFSSASKFGVAPERICCLPNVLDLPEFDGKYNEATSIGTVPDLTSRIVVVSVGRLVPQKRLDRFIDALASARQKAPELFGLIVGDGPERDNLKALAQERGLSQEDLVFLGRRDDIPSILRHAHFLALTSDHEGFPNVLLEAMAGKLPVIATPAGDSGRVVRDGVTGDALPFEDVRGFADRMIDLTKSAELRARLGREGRTRVEQEYGADGLAARLFDLYLEVATRLRSKDLIRALST